MNVAVYCGANFGKGERYRQAAEAMGHWIAENGHTLVYGGSNTGLMGILADTVLSAGGKAIGIIPEFLLEHGFVDMIVPRVNMRRTISKLLKLHLKEENKWNS